MTNAITNSTNALAAALPESTPVSPTSTSSASPTNTASGKRINRSPSPALSHLQWPAKRSATNVAVASPAEPVRMTPISALPESFLIGALQYCNGPDGDNAVTLSKQFKNLTIASRKKTVLALAAQPGRVSQEKLPTLLELWQMGIPNPHLTNILHTMKSELSGQLGNDGIITRNTKAHAVLQQTQRVFGQAGGLARRVPYMQATDIGQVNAQGQTHGFGIRTWQNEPLRKYIGNFRNVRMDGFGYLNFANGVRFEGTYVYGRANGPGKQFSANGDRFEGTYVEGRRNGTGKEFRANGDRIEVMFVNGQRHGPCIETLSNGEQRTTHYDMGQLVIKNRTDESVKNQ